MKVLVCDPLADRAVERLKQAGMDLTIRTGMSDDELREELSKGPKAVVVRSATKLRADALASAQGVELIVRAGVGLDNIDVDAAQAKGIRVENTPKASSDSVAELALGHMFALARHVPQATQSMREGRWEKKAFKGSELQGKTLGVIGIGRIGQALARRALCLGMDVVAFDAYIDTAPLQGVEMVSKQELLKRADFVSLHAPPDPTGPVIGAGEIAQMKEGAYLVNCARGGVVDEAALLSALEEGKLAGAGLDVFEEEPPTNVELLQHPKVVLTPHVGAQTVEAQGRVGDEVVDILVAYARSA